MLLRFAKMHGLGNDFMVVDTISQPVYFNETQIKKLADRHRGIGFDQLLLVEPPQQPNTDFHYRIFNADGNEVEQCGNGARCLARFVRIMGLTWKYKMRISTLKGVISARLHKDGNVTIEMGIPNFEPSKIPISDNERRNSYRFQLVDRDLSLHALSMGNPHAVLPVEKLEDDEVQKLGEALSKHPMLPQQGNIGFMQRLSEREMNLRVFERGVGETQACGTGACAAAAVGRLFYDMNNRIKVTLPGGYLTIDWEGEGQPLLMTGPAEYVYEGQIEL